MCRYIRIFSFCLFIIVFDINTKETSAEREVKESKQDSTTTNLDTIYLHLSYFHQFQFAGYYAALDKGFYQDVGLNVVICEGGKEGAPINEVLSSEANYGVGAGEILLHHLNKQALVMVAVIFQHSPKVLLASQESGIYTPHDLIGKRVMLEKDEQDVAQIVMINNEGVPSDKLQRLTKSHNLEDLIHGKTDAVSAYLTNEPYYLQQVGFKFNIINPINYGVDFYGDGLFTSQIEAKWHPKRVEAFRDASIKGWKFAFDNTEEITDLILQRYNPRKTKKHLLYEAQKIRELVFPELIEIGHMNPGRWSSMAEKFKSLELCPNNVNMNNFLFDPEQSTLHRLYHATFDFLLTLSMVFGIGLLLLYFHIRRLRYSVDMRTSEIQDANHKLHLLMAHMSNLQENERSRISRDLHDDLGHQLTEIKLEVSSLEKMLQKGFIENSLSNYIRKIISLSKDVDNAINHVRSIATELRPSLLDTMGLVSAIEWQIKEFSTKTGIQCKSNLDECPGLDSNLSMTIYRILQESLTNVMRHAKASKVNIELYKKNKYIVLVICDNGIGIANDHYRDIHSLGLFGIRERVLMLNGKLDIQGKRGKGTTLKVHIPLVESSTRKL